MAAAAVWMRRAGCCLAGHQRRTTTTTGLLWRRSKVTARALSSDTSSGRKADLVIYDKDGTLIDFDAAWTPWVKNLAQKLSDAAGMNLFKEIYAAMGYNPKTSTWSVVHGQHHSTGIYDALSVVMQGRAFNKVDADAFVRKYFVWATMDSPEYVVPIGDVATAFEALKRNGIKIAICTADERDTTVMGLDVLGVRHLVDNVHCSDDEGSTPKPDGQNLVNICRELAVSPARTVMIGDHVDDLRMGRNANVMMTVAVLTGLGERHLVEEFADAVVPTHEGMLPLVLGKDYLNASTAGVS